MIWGDYRNTYLHPDPPAVEPPLVETSTPLHPLSWLAIPLMVAVVVVALVALVVPVLPVLLR